MFAFARSPVNTAVQISRVLGSFLLHIFIMTLHNISFMLKLKREINRRDFWIVDLPFAKSELFSLTWSCESRDAFSSGEIENLPISRLKG